MKNCFSIVTLIFVALGLLGCQAGSDHPPTDWTPQRANFGILEARATVSDTPLALSTTELKVKVEVFERMARSTVTQVFHNNTKNRAEGKYRIALPRNAHISGLSVEFDGKLIEAKLAEVDGQRHDKTDPDRGAGPSAPRGSVFIDALSIEANSKKKIVLSYDQLL